MRLLPDTVYIPRIPSWSPDVRVELYNILCVLQKNICPVCNQLLEHYQIQDVHECVVTRGDVQGWPDEWNYLIFNLYNCAVVHRDCHKHGHKEFWWKYMCELWGKEDMKKWYYNLPFRVLPRRFE